MLARLLSKRISSRYLAELVNTSRLVPICIGKDCYFWVEDIQALKKQALKKHER